MYSSSSVDRECADIFDSKNLDYIDQERLTLLSMKSPLKFGHGNMSLKGLDELNLRVCKTGIEIEWN